MKPVLRVVAGADAPAGKWRRPKRHHVVGGAVIAAALALGGWLYLHPLDPPKLNAMHTVLILAGIWLLAKFIQGWWEGPQREPDQVVHHVHTHRRGWW